MPAVRAAVLSALVACLSMNAHAIRLEADNPAAAPADLSVDGAPARSLEPYGSLTIELSPGPHTLRIGVHDCSFDSDILATSDPRRSYTILPMRYSSELELQSLDRTIQLYRHILRGQEPESPLKHQPCQPVTLSWGLAQEPSPSFRGPMPRPGPVQNKLYRLPSAAPETGEALAALETRAAAYRPQDRLALLALLEKAPWSEELSARLLRARGAGRTLTPGLEARLAREAGAGSLLDAFAAASPERRHGMLEEAAALPWDKARALGEKGLSDPVESVRAAAVSALARPEVAADAALTEKARRVLGSGPGWKAPREALERVLMKSAAAKGGTAAVELVLKLEGSDPISAFDAASACMESEDDRLHAALERRLLGMPKAARRKLMLRARDQPFAYSPGRASVLIAALKDADDFNAELAAHALLAGDFSRDSDARAALAELAASPRADSNWKFQKLKKKIDALND